MLKLKLKFLEVAAFIFLIFILLNGCGSDTGGIPPGNQTVLFSDGFQYSFPGNKWTTSGTIHIDSTEGFPLPSLNTGNGFVTNVGTFSTSQDLTFSVSYRKLDTASLYGVNIRMLDNGSQYILAAIYKDNIRLYIPSQNINQSFQFYIDTTYHTFTDKITTDGKNNFYRDNTLFYTDTIPGVQQLSFSLSSPNVAARFDNVLLTTP